jgi:hypothetical protein
MEAMSKKEPKKPCHERRYSFKPLTTKEAMKRAM